MHPVVMLAPSPARSPKYAPVATKVPQITVLFWVVKVLTTGMGEATSDWSVHALPPELAVLIGFAGFLIALGLQLRMRRYNPWTYWLAVCGVGVFGTMAADVLHVALHVPYIASSILYAVILAAVFVAWQRTERTLSIHTIDTTRRELFYWAAVVATFAMGTAVGDLTATQDVRGEWMLRETLYQVDVATDAPAPVSVLAGRLVVPTGVLDALASATRHSLQVLVRESGF